MSCNGDEATIIDCVHNGWGNIAAGCTHMRDVGVECIGMLYMCCIYTLFCNIIDFVIPVLYV